MKCNNCDHTPSDCLSCEAQIFNAHDPDVILLDEWARVARMRDNRYLSDGLTMCADLLTGLKYCRTPEKLVRIAECLSTLTADVRVRSIRERFRVLRLEIIK